MKTTQLLNSSFKYMILALRSPFGGNPIRLWMKTEKKGIPNMEVCNNTDSPRITEESFYCLKIGYNKAGEEVLIKDCDGSKLYNLLKRYYA